MPALTLDLPIDRADDRAQAAIARAAAGQLLNLHDMAAIFGVAHTTAWRQAKRGDYDAFKAKPAIGKRIYSGTLVTRYLHGDPLYEQSFGRRTFDATGKKR